MKLLRCVPRLAMALAAAAAAPLALADASTMQACRGDAISLCRRVSPGGGRVAACLETHKSQLSPACAAALPQVRQCAQELVQLCESVAGADADALRRCARERVAEFSPACRVAP